MLEINPVRCTNTSDVKQAPHSPSPEFQTLRSDAHTHRHPHTFSDTSVPGTAQGTQSFCSEPLHFVKVICSRSLL